MNARVPPADAALDFVELLSPRANAAFLGVSATRTDTSDLDIVIVGPEGPYREGFIHDGWHVAAPRIRRNRCALSSLQILLGDARPCQTCAAEVSY